MTSAAQTRHPIDDLCETAPGYIRAIAPYQPGRPITAVARELGLDVSAIVKLASNENPSGMSPQARQAVADALGIEYFPFTA